MTKKELMDKAIESWRQQHGIGSAIIPSNFDSLYIIKEIINKILSVKDSKILIVSNGYEDRSVIITNLKNNKDEEVNNKFKEWLKSKKIVVLTNNFIKDNNYYSRVDLVILYNVVDICEKVFDIFIKSKFKLNILEQIPNNKLMSKVLSTANSIKEFNQKDIDLAIISTPVEEMRIPIVIPNDSNTYKLLEHYNKYIADSISIFGSFDIMNKLRCGDTISGMTAIQLCKQIAEENGWSETLDMSIPFNRTIDNMYNPNQLKDRVNLTYDYIKKREELLTSNVDKLQIISDIVSKNINSKILIINKHANFASQVTNHLNEYFQQDICGNYHSKLDPIPAINEFGQPVIYKTGRKAGERKYMGAQAQMTLNNALFNRGELSVLSTNNAPDRGLKGEFDIFIITSPKCEDVSSYMYRLVDVRYKDKLKIFTLYCADTLEQTALENKVLTNTHKIVKNSEV